MSVERSPIGWFVTFKVVGKKTNYVWRGSSNVGQQLATSVWIWQRLVNFCWKMISLSSSISQYVQHIWLTKCLSLERCISAYSLAELISKFVAKWFFRCTKRRRYSRERALQPFSHRPQTLQIPCLESFFTAQRGHEYGQPAGVESSDVSGHFICWSSY